MSSDTVKKVADTLEQLQKKHPLGVASTREAANVLGMPRSSVKKALKEYLGY
jgi:DNA-binding IclR family transcriptional regulator